MQFSHHGDNILRLIVRALRRGGTNIRLYELKKVEVREMGAPSSYLTRLLHNHSFARRYFELNHITRGRYGLT
jgi:hypothetical protein